LTGHATGACARQQPGSSEKIGKPALLNGMTLMAVSPEIKYVARGTVLALAVWMDVRLAKK
jgi:hypothetical protein